MSEYVECYENLKAAVVKLAADDYRRALIRLRRHPKDTNAIHTKIEASERSDVVGYAPSMDYEFDRYTNDAVHAKLAEITDDEILGSDAQVTVVVVDLFDATAEDANTCTARKRDWSVIPDSEGDGTDALIYKGSLKAAGEIVKGTATTTDKWQTCTFAAE